MSERTSLRVECPVCGEEFDPTAAGGWCTNSECGEWRYEGTDPTEEERGTANPDDTVDEAPTDDGSTEQGSDTTAAGRTSGADDSEPTPAIRQVPPEEGTSEAEPDSTDDATADETAADEGRVTAEEPPDREGVDAGDARADETEADTGDAFEEIECPGCGEALAADANFCPACGEDVSSVEPGGDESEALTECPSCGADVGPGDNFCVSCGEGLDAHRGDGSDELGECPDCGADVGPGDAFCAACGEDLDAHRGTAAGGSETADDGEDGESATTADGTESEPSTEEAPAELVLQARGESITVSDGDEIGREVRRIVTETGGDEDDAVRIHREHVRFVREDGQFHVVDLGRNPTTLNDARMDKGDRMPVEPDDELGLSGVVTLSVQAP